MPVLVLRVGRRGLVALLEEARGALPKLRFGSAPGGDAAPDARWMAATMRPANLIGGGAALVAAPKCTVNFGRDASAMLAVAACV